MRLSPLPIGEHRNCDGEEDDHDNRRLPKKRRMEIVMKNKAEANELFGDGNYKFAAARYTKALSHCAKFVDLSPDDIEEVNGVKLSLNLNLALAYIKLQNPDQALRVCNFQSTSFPSPTINYIFIPTTIAAFQVG